MEWSERDTYNSFNSLKGLAYYENYRRIMRWLQGETDELPLPVECNLDPVAECNLRCYWCVGQRYLRHKREEVVERRLLPTDYVLQLIDFLARWGVKGLCISGGGEPTLHKDLWRFIPYARDRNMDVAVVTNATNISDKLAESLTLCRWVALSVDIVDMDTYMRVKGADKFNQVVANISRLAQLREKSRSSVDLCFKVLVLPENTDSIYKACKLAKELGVQDFHVRPVDFERTGIEGAKKLEFDVPRIQEEFARCHELSSADFHVYTVSHKFDPEFHIKHDFDRCLAAPLIIPVLQDGNSYICVEQKMVARFRLGSCYPDPESILTWWGSDKHREILKGVVPDTDCSRCIYCEYHRQIEQVLLQDKMCLSFP